MTRTVDIRYQIVRNGADFGQIYAQKDDVPVLRMDDSDSIKMALAGEFVDDERIDWLTDEIRPELVIDGVPYPLGVYLPATVTPSESESTKSVRVEAFDRCWQVRDTYAETRLSFAAGASYIETVQQLLTAAGIVIVLATPNTATFSERREDWDIGTSYLTIVNDLLAEINYNPLWFNAQGAAVLEPASVPTAANIRHTLDADKVESLMMPELKRETDIYSAPNVFLCIVSNADKSGPMVAVSENTNPQSPLSIPRRGRRIMAVKTVNNIASQRELQAYADRLRNESMITGETLTVKTALLPGFGVADVTALHYGEISALCVERAWSMQLKPGGDMTHTLEKVVLALG